MIIKALLEGSLKGVGKHHRTPIFPCSIFQVGEGINKRPGDPNYDLFRLALKSTAKRLYPNYANIDWSGNAGYDKNDPTTLFSTIKITVALYSNIYWNTHLNKENPLADNLVLKFVYLSLSRIAHLEGKYGNLKRYWKLRRVLSSKFFR